MSARTRIGATALAIIALVFAALSFGGGAASAYPSGTNPQISLDHSAGPIGDKVVVTGEHFTPNKTADLSFHSASVPLGSVAVSASGTFSTTITVPSVPLGAHEVVALDVASGQSASAAFDVNGNGTAGAGGANGGGSGGLANTGVAVLGIGLLGLVLLVGGGLMLLAGRRRKALV